LSPKNVLPGIYFLDPVEPNTRNVLVVWDEVTGSVSSEAWKDSVLLQWLRLRYYTLFYAYGLDLSEPHMRPSVLKRLRFFDFQRTLLSSYKEHHLP
jgi:hypothetical protein